MSKKVIAILNMDSSKKTGGKRVAVNLSNALSNLYKLYYIDWYFETIAYPLNSSIEVKYLLNEKDKIRYDFYKLVMNLRNFIKDKSIDEIIVIGRYISLIAFFAVIKTNCKLTVCEHNSLKGYSIMCNTKKKKIYDILIRLCYRIFSNKIVFLTENDAMKYKKSLLSRNKRIYTIYNWIDKDLMVDKERIVYNQKSKKIITVGRIDYQKGYEYLVEIAKKVFEKHPDWEWHIYGSGTQDYENKIKELIKENKLENKLILKGIKDNIYDIYEEYSFFVMTSRFEGLPMVLLEAKAKKLPLISFDIETGPSEIIRNNIDGFLVKPFLINEMSNKINELIENPLLRQKFSNNSYGNIDKFKQENIIRDWKKLIEDV